MHKITLSEHYYGIVFFKKDPVIVKETSTAKQQIKALEELLLTAPDEIKPQIEQDMKLLSYGIYGEEGIYSPIIQLFNQGTL